MKVRTNDMTAPAIAIAGSLTVLCVDDEVNILNSLRRLLRPQGYRVLTAGSGAEGLAVLEQTPVDLVLSDMQMPEMDGVRFLEQVKARWPETARVLLTGYGDLASTVAAINQTEIYRYIPKPWDDAMVLKVVGDALERKILGREKARLEELTQKQNQALKELNATLQAANRELESFSSSVAHDLRAPLRHVDGYSAMLVQEMDGRLSPEAMRYLHEIVVASRRMSQLIDDLLRFSQMGGAGMQDVSVDLNALVQACIGELEMATCDRDVVWNVAPLPAATGDPAMLRQVFANLLGNAVKYTRPSSAAVIEIGSAGEENGRMIVLVRDNGVGFDMKHADKLFRPFQRLHSADQFEGTGLGLAHVQRILGRYGGRVWAEGKTGEGATFYFTLRPANFERRS